MKKAIITSISSDIGFALAKHFISHGIQVFGTYRTESGSVEDLRSAGGHLTFCDFSDKESVIKACNVLSSQCPQWDYLILCSGMQEPIGLFDESSFVEWENSINVNFLSQLHFIHHLLKYRNKRNPLGPCVLSFAGGGTNNATVRYSAYTISKISLIKMTELLDAEYSDTRFVIVGPGWVKTKIHDSTLKAHEAAGDNYQKTKFNIKNNNFTSMDDVIDCCQWLLELPREVISGRNFSVVFDAWGDERLLEELQKDNNMYKLRRSGNNKLIRNTTK